MRRGTRERKSSVYYGKHLPVNARLSSVESRDTDRYQSEEILTESHAGATPQFILSTSSRTDPMCVTDSDLKVSPLLRDNGFYRQRNRVHPAYHRRDYPGNSTLKHSRNANGRATTRANSFASSERRQTEIETERERTQ